MASRAQRLLLRCCGKLEVVKGKTLTTALALAAALALLVLGPLVRTVVSISYISMGLEELDLLTGLHCRRSLHLSKEANIR